VGGASLASDRAAAYSQALGPAARYMRESLMTEPDHIRAHKHCSYHREEVMRSKVCGCFYCLAVFNPTEILDWIDEKNDIGQTALCPKCGIDSVIGSESGFPISKEFLEKMQQYWFESKE
jgi:hypothetical protein